MKLARTLHSIVRTAVTLFVLALVLFSPSVATARLVPGESGTDRSSTSADATPQQGDGSSSATGGTTTLEPASCNYLPESFCGGTVDDLVSGVGSWLFSLIIAVSLIMIVVSGAQMASASDSPDRLKAAKGRLTGAIVALVFLVLFRAIMAWLGILV